MHCPSNWLSPTDPDHCNNEKKLSSGMAIVILKDDDPLLNPKGG